MERVLENNISLFTVLPGDEKNKFNYEIKTWYVKYIFEIYFSRSFIYTLTAMLW